MLLRQFKTFAAMALIALAAVFITAPMAIATTISFEGTADGTDFSISFDDNVANQITVQVTSTASPNQADLFGLAFDWAGSPPAPTVGDFYFLSSNTGEGITNVCLDTLVCGPGNALNFNGTLVAEFDYIVRMGDQGTQGGLYLEDFSFYIASALTVEDFLGDSFGIRAQSTGLSGEDSIKLVTFERISAVPVPATGLLLLGALGLLIALRRRRKTA